MTIECRAVLCICLLDRQHEVRRNYLQERRWPVRSQRSPQKAQTEYSWLLGRSTIGTFRLTEQCTGRIQEGNFPAERWWVLDIGSCNGVGSETIQQFIDHYLSLHVFILVIKTDSYPFYKLVESSCSPVLDETAVDRLRQSGGKLRDARAFYDRLSFAITSCAFFLHTWDVDSWSSMYFSMKAEGPLIQPIRMPGAINLDKLSKRSTRPSVSIERKLRGKFSMPRSSTSFNS